MHNLSLNAFYMRLYGDAKFNNFVAVRSIAEQTHWLINAWCYTVAMELPWRFQALTRDKSACKLTFFILNLREGTVTLSLRVLFSFVFC